MNGKEAFGRGGGGGFRGGHGGGFGGHGYGGFGRRRFGNYGYYGGYPTYYYPYDYTYYYPQTYYVGAVENLPDLTQEYRGAILAALATGPGPFQPSHYIGKYKGDIRLASGEKVNISPDLLYTGVCQPTFMFRKTERTGFYEPVCVSSCCFVNKSPDQCKSCGMKSSLVPVYEPFSSTRGYF